MASNKMFDRSFLQRRTPPPDYNSRGIRLRIFGVLACLLLVAAVAERARNPASWKWMFELGTAPQNPRVSNRLPSKEAVEEDPGVTIVTMPQTTELAQAAPPSQVPQTPLASTDPAAQEQSPAEPKPAPEPPRADDDPLAATWRDGWDRIYVTLEQRERTDLFRIAAAGLGEHEVTLDDEPRLVDLLARIERLWQAYATEAHQTVANLGEAERTPWLDILRQANHRWSEDLKRGLTKASGGATLSTAEQTAVRAWREVLESLALKRVTDDSPLRPDENEGWFRLVERARRGLADEQTRGADLKPTDVSYLHLAQQSDFYRGQWVRVKGVALRAYRSPANRNPWGVTDYTVIWIQPEDGSNAPIVAYALELPPGFPTVPPASEDQPLTKIHADVVVEGLFFKRWAYPGADGTYTAPLVITRTLMLPAPTYTAMSNRWELSWGNILLTIAAALGMALVASGVILWRIRDHERAQQIAEDNSFNPAILAQLPMQPSTAENLRKMEEEAASAKPPGG